MYPSGVLVLLNCVERQIMWSLCSVDFLTFTLQLPVQTSLYIGPELRVFMSSLEKCQNFSKTSTLQECTWVGCVCVCVCVDSGVWTGDVDGGVDRLVYTSQDTTHAVGTHATRLHSCHL